MSNTKYDFDCTTADLEIGDVIRIPSMPDAPWNTGIVKNATPEQVNVFRPYGTTSDFTTTGGVICYTGLTTGGVICYTGLEMFTINRSTEKVHVYQRPTLK